MITRRKLIIALGAGTFAPLTSFAQQQGKVWRIGHLQETVPSNYGGFDAFKAGMSALGYMEGRDYVVERRSADSDLARL